jgi:PKD repeat protein
MRQLSFIPVVCIILFSGLIFPVHGLPVDDGFSSLIGDVNISTAIPDSPSSATAYRIISDSNDMAYYSVTDLEKLRPNVTSVTNAPYVAANILNTYGGLPKDAVLTTAETEYLIEMNGTTDQEISRVPVCTNVQYGRKIDDVPVVGEGAYINMDLGENGELLYLNKAWRTVTPAGNISISPVYAAIEKLRHGEVLNPKSDPFNVTITKIRLGYYEKGRNESQEYLDPAWLFKGITESGDPIQYYVYTRRFANFTSSQTTISTFQTVKFTDTSETTPTKWYWDFGDGTNSTYQNPSHVYRATGNFTISLRAWNDMGSDTETKTNYITVSYQKPINADFNVKPPAATAGEDIQFYDASDSSPNKWYWDFGDGTNSTDENPTHAYAAGGNYTVNLTAWNQYGSDTVSHENTIFIYPTPAPVADFISNYSRTYSRSPITVVFNDTSQGNISRWIWDFGDGTNSTEPTPVHIFSVLPGKTNSYYEVNLTIVDNYGRTSSAFDNFYITRGYYPDFNGIPKEGFAPLNVTFTDLTSDSDTVYIVAWDFGDGESYDSRLPHPMRVSHEYMQPGTYNVTLTYYDEIRPRLAASAKAPADSSEDNGSEGYDWHSYYRTKEFYIVVTEPAAPVADFTANITSGKDTLPVLFRDQSIGFPTAWNWSFGDGAFAADRDPVHLYSTVGNYTVSLMVSNADDDNTTVKTDYISILSSHHPVAKFTANITEGKSPLSISFTDDSTNSPVNWTWEFGDDTNSTERNPVHVYTNPGRYTVFLCAMNDEGGDNLTKPEYITVLMDLPPVTIATPQPAMPVSNFTATPLAGKEPLTVIFNDSSTGIPIRWSWSFGDGATTTMSAPVHNYTSAGNYTVSLTTTNSYGSNTTTRVDYINVFPKTPPVAGFTANSTAGNSSLAIAFTDTSTNSPTTWNWTFGDGTRSTVQNPVHQYLSASSYSISLTVTNPDGSDTKTRTNYITVTTITGPIANFTGQPIYGKAPLKITFNDTSTGSPTKWYWTFGDGTDSTVQNPVHTYSSNGKYTVSLTATNAGGSSTKTRTEYVLVSCSANPPLAKFVARPTSGMAPLNVKFNDISTGSPTSWHWIFGDGTNATEQNPVHIYSSAGKYTVSLTVSNSLGNNTRIENEYLTVKPIKQPSAYFSGKPTSGRAPLSVVFNDTSSGSPTNWTWDFGDGTNSTAQNPVHAYVTSGKFTVSMTVSNAGGSDTKTRKQYIAIAAPMPTPTTTTIKPTVTCSPKPTTTCTIKPTIPTIADSPCTVPHVTGLVGNSTVRLDWNVITDSRLQGYKVVISKNNPGPKYPNDGYMYWITDRYQNYSVIDTKTAYNGGDIGGYLKPGQSYYFSITAVYTNENIPGNGIRMTYPAHIQTPETLPTGSPELPLTPTLTTAQQENESHG